MRYVRKYDLSTLSPRHLDVAHDKFNPARTRPLTSSEMEMVIARARSDFELLNDVYGKADDAYLGYKVIEWESGVPPSLPTLTLNDRVRVKNAHFSKRAGTGEIVMAPYSVDNISVEFQYGKLMLDKRSPRHQSVVIPRSFLSDPWATIDLGGNWQTANLGAMSFSMTSWLYTEELKSPLELGWNHTPRSIRMLLQSYYTVENPLVTSALAGANKGQMDMLTFLAELPETVKSVLEGFRLVAKLAKDAKNKEFSLTSKSKQRRKALDDQLATKLAAINERRAGADAHRRRILDNHARKVRRHYLRETDRLLREFNDGLASIWMNFRYNIMPNVYAVDDALELLGALYNEYESSRERDKFEHTIVPPDGFKSVTSESWILRHKCLVKSRYAINQNMTQRLLSHGSANFMQTLWELGTRTFVIDWFLNIGDFLIALLGVDTSEQRMTSYSHHIDQKLAFVHEETDARVYVTTNCYNRSIINPYDCITISVSNNLNLFRMIDSVAMLWPSIKRLLSSSR